MAVGWVLAPISPDDAVGTARLFVPWVGRGAIPGFLLLLQNIENRNVSICFAEKQLEGPG